MATHHGDGWVVPVPMTPASSLSEPGDERLLVGVGGAVGCKTEDDTGDLRQDVLKDDGDSKAHHKAHTEGLDDTLRGHNIEQAGSGAANDDAKVAQQRAGKPEGDGGEAHQKPMDSNMGEL